MEFTRNIKGKGLHCTHTALLLFLYCNILFGTISNSFTFITSIKMRGLISWCTRVYNQQQHIFLKNVHQNTNKNNFSLLMSVYAIFF